jgi:hypothetical protein
MVDLGGRPHSPPTDPRRTYADAAGEETFKKYQTIIYLGASASAEFFADMALCPFEAVKVRACGAGKQTWACRAVPAWRCWLLLL